MDTAQQLYPAGIDGIREDWGNETYRIALCNVADPLTVAPAVNMMTVSQVVVPNEVAGTGYNPANRPILVNAVDNEDYALQESQFGADDITFAGLDVGDANMAVIYKEVTDDDDSVIVATFYKSTADTTNGTDYTVSFPGGIVLKISFARTTQS